MMSDRATPQRSPHRRRMNRQHDAYQAIIKGQLERETLGRSCG